MSMKKYTQSEGKVEVLRGEEADTLLKHTRKLGKSVSDFSEDEKASLDTDLQAARESATSDDS